MTKFQLTLTAIFVIFIIAGVFVFATYKSSDTTDKLPLVTIWGTLSQSVFDDFVSKLNPTLTTPIAVKYVEVPRLNFRKQLIEELASGRGPDAVLISQQEIMSLDDKIVEIPNTLITQRDFQNTFVGQADLYLTKTGTLAIPIIVDPMVMYWNRSTFTNSGIAKYPQYWDEFSGLVNKITVKDVNSNVRKSAIALGEFKNINHAKEILSALLLQAGNTITNSTSDGLRSSLDSISSSGTQTSSPALAFFTKFSNPRDPSYSWNRSLITSKNNFLSGDLATYFGLTSEIADLKSKNPNMDFDIAPLPQARSGKNRVTFGDMYGLSIIKSTMDVNNTYTVIKILTDSGASTILSNLLYLPSARRDIIASGSVDPYMAIFLDASLISRGWLDTNPTRSNQIFTDMVESITSGRAEVYSALRQANDELNISLQNK